VIAAFERLGHLSVATERKWYLARQ
jgi:hypothetical protein